MNEVMRNILLLSFVGSALAIVLLCVKPLTKRLFSPKWQYYIWLTVLIVMVLPIKVSLPAKPVYTTPMENRAVQTQQITAVEAQPKPEQLAVFEETAQRPILKIPDIPNGIAGIFGFLWLAAAILLLGYRMTKYMMFLRTIKKNSVIEYSLENVPKRLAVRKTELLDAPLMAGLIKPVLYLPQTEIREDELDYILFHELTHYRRRDLLYKWFAMLVSSIHWFNPFVYMVVKQIDEECEISCDYEVCKMLSETQKKDYMMMILDFVQTSIQKTSPLTTQMASSKKMLKRRFWAMKKKKVTGKFVSVLSVVLAVTLLSATVFASGVLSGLTENNYIVEIADNGGVIELVNKPFIENGAVYVPLREMMGKVGLHEENSYIHWDNGTIDIAILNDFGENGLYRLSVGSASLQLRHFQEEDLSGASMDGKTTIKFNANVSHGKSPVLKGSTTYVPLDMANYIFYGFLNIRDENNVLCQLDYAVYDKLGNNITEMVKAGKEANEEFELMKRPETTTGLFFNAFSSSDFDKMKDYCTQSCVEGFFGAEHVFGMKQAKVADMQISDAEYAKSSNDFNIFVTVDMTPHESSVFDPAQTSTSFYVCLLRQPDGRYLINEFATGL